MLNVVTKITMLLTLVSIVLNGIKMNIVNIKAL
jgi:hypothetical protein